MAENYYYSSLSGDEIESRLVGAVVFNATQVLTTSQKEQARQNIGAGASDTKVIIMGYFDTLEELESRYPVGNLGDAYGVGTESPYNIYIWDNVHSVWVNNGPIVLSDAVIDDEDISTDTAWSSSKTNTEVGAVRTLADAAQTTADGKAPISHASTAATYGVGNSSEYGHVKLSDSPNASQGTGSGVAATPAAVQSAINAGKWKLLWTNPNPSSAFAAQTISLDLSQYSEVRVVVKQATGVNTFFNYIGFVGYDLYADIIGTFNSSAIMILNRRQLTISTSGIAVMEGRKKPFNSTSYTADNNEVIPYQIFAR